MFTLCKSFKNSDFSVALCCSDAENRLTSSWPRYNVVRGPNTISFNFCQLCLTAETPYRRFKLPLSIEATARGPTAEAVGTHSGECSSENANRSRLPHTYVYTYIAPLLHYKYFLGMLSCLEVYYVRDASSVSILLPLASNYGTESYGEV